jgi:DTW domain-containing protein YfiP
VLFPAEASQNLARACVEAHQRIARSEQSQQQCEWAYVLLAIDGTWRQGREMYRVRAHVWTRAALTWAVWTGGA